MFNRLFFLGWMQQTSVVLGRMALLSWRLRVSQIGGGISACLHSEVDLLIGIT